MSIPVDPADLRSALADFDSGYLVSTSSPRVKVVTVDPVVDDAGRLRIAGPGRGTSANVTANPTVTVVFPPRERHGYTLLVDGEAVVDGDDVLVTATGAVLHRPAAHADGPLPPRRLRPRLCPDRSGMSTTPFWLTAFLDHAPERHADGVAFWATVTGYALSPARGEAAEFATLVPPTGDDFLRVQRLADGPGGLHLDLHVEDPRAAADAALAIGAREIADHGHVVLASPAGQEFCFVSHRAARVPAPVAHEGGAARVVQVALDVPPAQHEAEVLFWQTLTGWERRASTIDEAFTFLVPPAGAAVPLRLLVQRLADADAAPGAHLDWGSTDHPATVAHHVALGARVLAVHPLWTVLADPVDRVYCVTAQRPS